MMRVRFRPNWIFYGQDMGFHHGIPDGVWFDVEASGDHYVLRADGYGSRSGKYGNGALYVRKADTAKAAK